VATEHTMATIPSVAAIHAMAAVSTVTTVPAVAADMSASVSTAVPSVLCERDRCGGQQDGQSNKRTNDELAIHDHTFPSRSVNT